MGMHDDDGIYTATCRYFRDADPVGPLRGSSTTQHTSRAAAFEALNQALHAARADRATQIDVSLTRDDTALTQVIFAAGPRHIDNAHPELDEQRSPYSRGWEILTTHANEILPELRNPHSPVHQPLSPELRDVAWSARNVHDATHWTIDALQAHLDGELDRTKDRARDAGHSEAQIDSAARTDPDLDMKALRQHSADLLDTVRNFSADPALTPAQAGALSAAADRAEDAVAELAAHSSVPPAAPALDRTTNIERDVTAAVRLAASDFPDPARSVLVSPSHTPPARNPEPTRITGISSVQSHDHGR
ncbi:hypothetical protein ACFTWF_35040 [Rhodococcus sp. NPDC056960]|uniref:hypothetical protein n=1 Tax=Rhodococcus sp. NPDC056960 TaxID=3345982 RepID=UPI0036338693